MPTEGNDTIIGTPGNDTINGLGGDDWIEGRAGDDSLIGIAGIDTMFGGAGQDTIDCMGGYAYGEAGNDSLRGWGNATLIGGDGADTLYAQSDDVVASGGAGADLFETSSAANVVLYLTDFNPFEDRLAPTRGIASARYWIDLDGDGQADDAEYRGGAQTIYLLNFDTAAISGFWNGATLSGIQLPNVLVGTAGAETILGQVYGDQIFARDGADLINGDQGNDTLYGEGGNDTIFGGDGSDLIVGGAGDDSIVWGPGNDTVYGEDGRDFIGGGEGNDLLVGGDAADTLNGDQWSGQWGNDSLFGGSGNDSLTGGGNDDLLDGGTGDDTLVGSTHSDTLIGGEGNDLISKPASGPNSNTSLGLVSAGDGNDTIRFEAKRGWIDGGVGIDRVTLYGSGEATTVTVDLVAGTLMVSGSSETVGLWNVEDIYMYAGTARGSAGADRFAAFFSLRAEGFGGSDTLVGGLGNDTLDGGDGDDLLDLAVFRSSGAGIDFLYGGSGTDTLSVAAGIVPHTVSLAHGALMGPGASWGGLPFTAYFADVEVLRLGAGDDLVTGWSGPVRRIELGAGNDWFADYATAANGGGTVNDVVYGEAGDDALYGLAGNDLLDGGSGNNLLFGGDGADTLAGGIAGDWMDGGDSGDFLFGGDGADTLIGGAGGDWMGGGAGADLFRFLATTDSSAATGYDAVGQFQTGVDRLDLSAIDANTGAAGDQAFTIGALAVGQAGRLQITTTSGYTLVEGDVNGDGVADIAFFVWSETGGVAAPAALAAGDFIL
jgi:Ca2+-binding RTX toxin-like protein